MYCGNLITNKYAEKFDHIFMNWAIKFYMLKPVFVLSSANGTINIIFENWIYRKLATIFKSSRVCGDYSDKLFCVTLQKIFENLKDTAGIYN